MPRAIKSWREPDFLQIVELKQCLRKREPTHPGAILREDVLPSLPGMSVSEFARRLGVSRQTLRALLSGRSGVSAEMALRLGTLLGNGAQLWLDMQTKFDLWQAEAKLHD